jgi:uncharacterized cupin superfamily protein
VARVPFQSYSTSVEMRPSPIVAGWIREGNPVARVGQLSRSSDLTATTLVWDCTAGKFDWTYDCDETVYIIDGHIVLSDDGNAPKRLGPGDVVFFPKGAQVSWHVESYVRKVATLHKVLPGPAVAVLKALRQVKRMVKGETSLDPMGLAGGFPAGPAQPAHAPGR